MKSSKRHFVPRFFLSQGWRKRFIKRGVCVLCVWGTGCASVIKKDRPN